MTTLLHNADVIERVGGVDPAANVFINGDGISALPLVADSRDRPDRIVDLRGCTLRWGSSAATSISARATRSVDPTGSASPGAVCANTVTLMASRVCGTATTQGGSELTVAEIRKACEEAHHQECRVTAHAAAARAILSATEAAVDTIEHGCLADEPCLAVMVERVGCVLKP